MAQYLDNFAGVLKKRQAEQILKLLNKQKERGEIRTVEEFRNRLDNLVRQLNQSIMTPTLRIFEAKTAEIIDSETFNFMLDRVVDDLSASFEESNLISELQDSHEAIIRDVILKNLQYGIAELESKVALYQFLNEDRNGFDSAIFSTFRESKEQRSNRSIDQSTILFTDPKVGDIFDSTEDALVDLIGERLILNTNLDTEYLIRDIRQIFDSESPQSELIVEPATNNIRNIIDDTVGTYWIQTLLFSQLKSFVKVKLQLDISSTKDINIVQIEPANLKGVFLESIDYIDGNNLVVNILNPNQFFVTPIKIPFHTITTKTIILTFRNENYLTTQFQFGSNDTLFNQAFLEPPEGLPKNIETISEDLNKILGSETVKNIIGVTVPTQGSFSGYAFTTGFDNIRVGLSKYIDRSWYISSPLKVEEIGQVGLKVSETRPISDILNSDPIIDSNTYDISDSKFPHGSIEYYCFKRDFDSSNNILATTRFPLLPIDITRISQERLILVEKSQPSNIHNDIGYLNFFTDRIVGDVHVYRNGVELLFSSVPAIVDGWTDETTISEKTPDVGIPMVFKIKIQQPSVGDIFTVTYTPLTSNTITVPKLLSPWSATGLTVVDMIGDLSVRLLSSKINVIDQILNKEKITSSEIFLGILLRNNTANSNLTPSVEEYTLVVGHKDQTKFLGFDHVQ